MVKWKRFVVDMVALNVFIVCTAFIVEVVLSGIAFLYFGMAG